MGHYEFSIVGKTVYIGVVSCYVGLEPRGVLEHELPFYDNLTLDAKMTFLAQGGDIPPIAILGIEIQMVDCQTITIRWIMGIIASNACPSSLIFDLPSDLFPIIRIGADRFPSHLSPFCAEG
jgi:hypothetical protein